MAHSFRLKDGTPLHIREARTSDAADIIAYIQRVSAESDFLTFEPGEFTQHYSIEKERQFIRSARKTENQLLLIAQVKGEITGAISYHGGERSRTRHAGELGMSVRQAYWGQGIASRMLDVLIDWARESGIVTKLNLRVRVDNERAFRLYEGKGFAIEGTLRKEMRVGDRYYDLHWMGLEVG